MLCRKQQHKGDSIAEYTGTNMASGTKDTHIIIQQLLYQDSRLYIRNGSGRLTLTTSCSLMHSISVPQQNGRRHKAL
jgi:hypothetical protein